MCGGDRGGVGGVVMMEGECIGFAGVDGECEVVGGVGGAEAGVGAGDLQWEDGAFTDEGGVFIEGEGLGDLGGAGEEFGIVEEVAPLAGGQVDCVAEVIAVDGGDEDVIAEEVVVASWGGPHEWGGAVVGLDDLGVEVGDEFRVQPGELADDLEFLGRAEPEATFAMAAVEEETGEAGELCPADIESGWDGVSTVVAADVGADD
ncbi:MAG: hypothetical protein RI897_1815 [Verrucomicrobiota bacterium]